MTVVRIKRRHTIEPHYVANPLPDEEIMPRDRLTLYGPETILVAVRDVAA